MGKGNYQIDGKPTSSRTWQGGTPLLIEPGAQPWVVEWLGETPGYKPPNHPRMIHSSLSTTPRLSYILLKEHLHCQRTMELLFTIVPIISR